MIFYDVFCVINVFKKIIKDQSLGYKVGIKTINSITGASARILIVNSKYNDIIQLNPFKIEGLFFLNITLIEISFQAFSKAVYSKNKKINSKKPILLQFIDYKKKFDDCYRRKQFIAKNKKRIEISQLKKTKELEQL